MGGQSYSIAVGGVFLTSQKLFLYDEKTTKSEFIPHKWSLNTKFMNSFVNFFMDGLPLA